MTTNGGFNAEFFMRSNAPVAMADLGEDGGCIPPPAYRDVLSVMYEWQTFDFCGITCTILSKIIKTIAIRCQILRLKCSRFDFGWGSTPDPAGGAYSAPPDPLSKFKGAYF